MNRAMRLAGVVVLSGWSWGCAVDEPAPTSTEVAATSGVTTADVEQTITKLEEQWVAAIIAKDAAAIERLLADDFVGTTNDRRYIKRDALEDVQEGTHELLRLDDVQIRVYGDTAIVDVDQTEKSRHGSDDFSGSYMFTNVWVKRDGAWQAVASHGSRVR